jgi:UDPglucose 6-dehydrogenase
MTRYISVIGTGYLGAVHAVGMAELGYTVVGVDVNPDKVASLQYGRAPFYEPDLDPLIRKHVDNGRLRFSTEIADAAPADVHFVCVGTPQRRDGLAADLTHLDAAIDSLGNVLRRPCLVVGKSTVPVGTAERLAVRVAEATPVGADAELAWNPEFLREGFGLEDTLHPDRLVFGVRSERAERTLREVYAPVIAEGVPVVLTDLPTAELVKAAANAFIATKISFINAMAEICEVTGADVTKLAEALGHDERIGRRFLDAGLGFGGGCLPKDIRAFIARAGEIGAAQSLAFLAEVDAVNLRRRDRQANCRARRCFQAQLRRCAGLAGPDCCWSTAPARSRGDRPRSEGHGQRSADLPDPELCRVDDRRLSRGQRRPAPHRVARVP